MPERLKGADCKSAGFGLRRFESFSLHQSIEGGSKAMWDVSGLELTVFAKNAVILETLAGVAQLARVSAFQAEGCGFETRLPLQLAHMAQG